MSKIILKAIVVLSLLSYFGRMFYISWYWDFRITSFTTLSILVLGTLFVICLAGLAWNIASYPDD